MATEDLKFFKTSNTEWEINKRGINATVTYGGPGANPYELAITAGPTTQHPTLRAAKNAFRKYLFDQPVLV